VSKFDGTDEPLTYGQALRELAGRVSWPSQEHAAEIDAAIRKEFGIEQAEPDPKPTDPQAYALGQASDRVAQLEAELARRDKAAAEARVAELEAKLAAQDKATQVQPGTVEAGD